ncbi:MAG: hypothetical protein RIB45_15390 [Marivibrio sp.]|uniref:hypothetical protein n=1 Tax=Marivibrio sp. TaxID=2039719 RepID=UPI0032EF2875
MADRTDATRNGEPAARTSAVPTPDAPEAAGRETGAYREALEDYADLIANPGDDPDAMRRLERRIADHLVDGAAPEAPSPAPEAPSVAKT